MTLRRRKDFKEEDLYEPIHKWFINEGYEVQAEVQSCDVVAQKDGELTIIELKKSFNLKLVYQCMERQKIAKYVYAAVANPVLGKKNREINKVKTLLKKLGIGFIGVQLYTGNKSMIEIFLEPASSTLRKNSRKKKKVIKEIENRSGDYNTGGKKGKIISAYREAAIRIYYLLHQEIEASPAQLVKLGAPDNTSRILRDNHYGWFHKISRGLYTFDVDVEEIKKDYGEVWSFLEDS